MSPLLPRLSFLASLGATAWKRRNMSERTPSAFALYRVDYVGGGSLSDSTLLRLAQELERRKVRPVDLERVHVSL